MSCKVAICFCGGCNPRIQRENIAADIQKQLSNQGYSVKINEVYGVDYVVYLSGCSANCSFRYRSKESHSYVFSNIAGESIDYFEVKEKTIASNIVAQVLKHFETYDPFDRKL